MLPRSLLCIPLALLAASPAAADATDGEPVDTLVVTALRLDSTATLSGSSVSVISAEDIAARGYTFALDALASAPGVTVNQNGSFGGQAGVRIRGAASEHTLTLIDGVPVNDPSTPGGSYNFANLDASQIERIEILRGPQSTLWGSDAMGGVVNIVTRDATRDARPSVFVEGGSYGYARTGAALGHTGPRGDVRLGIQRTRADGFSSADRADGNTEDDGYESVSATLRGGLDLAAGVRLDATARYVDSDNEFDGFGAVTGTQDADERGESTELSGNLSLRARAFDDRLHNTLTVGYAEIDRQSFSSGVRSYLAEGTRYLFRYQGQLALNADNHLLVGAEREHNATLDDDITIDSYFALYRFHPAESLAFSAGVRTDDHERFGSTSTRRATAAWTPYDTLTLRASWGEGFKAPSLFQTTYVCCGATQPNSALEPETSEGFDTGFEWAFAGGRGTLGVTYFEQDTTNLITFSSAAGGYENILTTRSRGTEVASSFRFSERLEASVNYSLIDAEDGDGARAVRVPEHSGELALRFRPSSAWSSAVVVRFNGEERDGRGTVGEWTRVDLSGSYQLSPAVQLYARLENALDEHYQQIYGYGTPGRSGHIGARIRL